MVIFGGMEIIMFLCIQEERSLDISSPKKAYFD